MVVVALAVVRSVDVPATGHVGVAGTAAAPPAKNIVAATHAPAINV
jgi:hypothetical protein